MKKFFEYFPVECTLNNNLIDVVLIQFLHVKQFMHYSLSCLEVYFQKELTLEDQQNEEMVKIHRHKVMNTYLYVIDAVSKIYSIILTSLENERRKIDQQ